MSICFIPRFFLLQWKRCGFKNMHNHVAPNICFVFVSVSTLVLHLCFSGEGRGDREDLRQLRSPSRLPHRPLCRCYEWVQQHHQQHHHQHHHHYHHPREQHHHQHQLFFENIIYHLSCQAKLASCSRTSSSSSCS